MSATRPVPEVSTEPTFQRLARLILTSFVFTFIAARVMVFLIVSRRIPDLYLYVGGTHVHHLNYGIFLLSAVGGYLLLGHPTERRLVASAAAYGIGLALTFDEFGLWLHLGGSYWQRASYDAIVVIGSLLCLIVVAPRLSQFRLKDRITAVVLAIALCIFAVMFVESFQYGDRLLLRMQIIEQSRPPLR